MPPPRPATEARSGSLEPGQPSPISQYASSSRPAAHAARRLDVRDRRQTGRRQTASSRGHNNWKVQSDDWGRIIRGWSPDNF